MVRARSAPVGASSGSGTKEDEEDEEALQRQREVVDEIQMMERGTDQSKVSLQCSSPFRLSQPVEQQKRLCVLCISG